jgi:UDP-N-acetylglucosamine:LPS N-acetylglucosamine transferase
VKKGVNANIQVVCGKDKKTFDELTAIKNSGAENLHVYKQVQSLATLMQACDLIIGKAGANTTNEARLYSKPMIIFFEQSRIEVEQAKYLCDKKCVIREKKISKIISLITQDTLRKGHLRSKLVGLDENVVDGVTQVVDGIYEMMKDKGLTE